MLSLATQLAALDDGERAAVLADLSDDELSAIEFDWPFWARPNQLAPPGDWSTWLLLAGRGFGKTRTGAEWVRGEKERIRRVALVAPTAGDARDVMVEGESGLLAISPPWDRPIYEPSKRRLTWPNGAQAALYSAEEPERLRGPQHGAAWLDELAAWKYPETYDMLQFGLRLGDHPRVVVTTTPKPIKLVRQLLRDPHTITTRGSTYDNAANLAPTFMDAMRRRYEGTRLGRQELEAALLDDVPGALWTREMLDAAHVTTFPADLKRVVVALDPATTSGEEADETGIVAVGLGRDGCGYLLEDATCREPPAVWASIAVNLLHKWRGDRIVAETNQGGEMVEATIRTVASNVPYTGVHATRGKVRRAEPVAALYEQHRVKHVGSFAALEDQLAGLTPDFDPRAAGYSPDRADALIWAVTELMVDKQARPARALAANFTAR